MLTCQQIIDKRYDLWIENEDIEKDKEYRLAIAEKLIENEWSKEEQDYVATDQAKSLQSEIEEDPVLLIEMLFVIVNKEQKTVPFFLNKVQREFIDELQKAIDEYRSGKRNFIRFLILKGRQQGFTSIITAYQLANTIITKNFVGMTVSHEKDSTNDIFEDKARYPYDHLPDSVQPTEKYNNRKELLFEKLNSKWRIATAGNEDIGRSKTLNFFHGSESAFWPSIESILSGLGQAITKDSIIILESTANGYNEFKEYWDDAVKENNNFIPLFFEWWKTPEYQLEFENDQIKKAFKDAVKNEYGYKGIESDFFTKLKNLYYSRELNWKQLYWYFNKKLELKNKLPQEYPCTPKEAFLHTGRPYFNLEKIDNLILDIEDNNWINKRRGGSITIWKEPEKGELYVIAGDVAEGIEDGDASSAIVYKVSTWEQVAKVHGHFAPDVYGDILVDLALEYNNAYLMIENNNHGWSTLNTVYNQREYMNIHFTTNQKNKDDKESRKMGWTTSEASKYLMLDELDSAIRNEEIIIRDKAFLEQAREVVYDEEGKVDLNGKDMVVANAIAWQGRKYATRGIATEEQYDWRR